MERKKEKVQDAGFEPARISTSGLESDPLDRSGNLAYFVCCSVSEVKKRTEKYVLMAGLEPATLGS